MPTYEYECPDGHRFEVFQRISEDPVADCPECGRPAERKISGGAGFLFKGEGFYITDYRSEDYKKKASAEGGAAPSKAATDAGEGGKAKGSEGQASGGAGADASGSSASPAEGSPGAGSGRAAASDD